MGDFSVVAAAAGGVSLEPYSKIFCKLNLPHTHSINLYVVMSAVKLAGAGLRLAYRENCRKKSQPSGDLNPRKHAVQAYAMGDVAI